MVVVEIYRGLLFALLGILACEFLVEEVGRDVVDIDEVYARLLDYLTLPAAIAVVATLYTATRPLVARREGE